MANTVTAGIDAALRAAISPDSGFFQGASRSVRLAIKSALGSGTAADQCDVVGVRLLTLVASTAQVVDLLADLADPVSGAAITTLARVRGLAARMEGTTDGSNCRMAADSMNGFTNLISTGGLLLLPATSKSSAGLVLSAPNTTGYAVTSTNKRLIFTPSAHAFSVRLVVIGASV